MDRDRTSGHKNAAVGIRVSITSRYTGKRKAKEFVTDESCSSGK